MSKLTELTREQFNEFKKIKPMHSPLYGDYTLYGRKGSKFIAKPLQHPFTSTRIFPIPFYLTQVKTKTYFFQLQGQSLDTILQQKLISNRLNSKHNSSELICWMTKYKSFQINLWEIFKLGVKIITTNPTEIILSCFRIIKGKLMYQYDSWYVSTECIARGNMQELEKYYFSDRALKNIRDGVLVQLGENEALYRLAFLVLHLGTRDMNLRFYEYGMYQLSHENMGRRLECFKKRYPKLGQKIQGIITETSTLQEYATLEEFSSINIDSTLMRNFNSSSVESLRRSQEKSIGKVKLVLAAEYQQQQKSSKKKIKMKTQESKILHLECSVLNLLDKMRNLHWSALMDIDNTTLLDYLNLQDYYPVSTYEQKVTRLLNKIYLKIIYSKKQYSNGSIYIGELLQDSRQGKGLYLFESGDIYYGDWKENNMHGFGAYIFKNGDSYQGELEKGLKQGHGKNQYASGNIYEGSWIGNHKKGLGVMYYKNGSMFVGEFFGNQKAAEGVYISPDGLTVEGKSEQENCSPSKSKGGKPIKLLLTENTECANKQSFEDGEYSGELVDGKRNGYGMLRSEREYYEGNWKNDVKHGEGRIVVDQQEIYGVWENGFILEYK